MKDKTKLVRLVQDAIDHGATTVEDIHRSIADLPLKVLDEVVVLKKPLKEVRKVQERSIGAVYDLIRDINQRVGKEAARLLEDLRPVLGRAHRRPRAAASRARHA